MGRTAPITSKRCILYIYSTNTGTEYFKHALYSPFFSLQNAVCFIMLTCLVPVLFTFYIQGVLKLKKNNSCAKRLIVAFCNFANASKNDYVFRIYHSYLRILFRCSPFFPFEIEYTWTYKIYITYAICFDYVGDMCLHSGSFHTALPLDTFLYAHWICIPFIINRKSI